MNFVTCLLFCLSFNPGLDDQETNLLTVPNALEIELILESPTNFFKPETLNAGLLECWKDLPNGCYWYYPCNNPSARVLICEEPPV